MDIFEIAQQGMKLQEEEKRRAEAELVEEEEKEKAYKLDIKEALKACVEKDYDWFNRLGDHQKHFQPYILNMWLSQVWTKNTSKAITINDEKYFEIVKNINKNVNVNLYSVPKEMLWLLACTVNEYDISEFNYDWVKSEKKGSSSKVDNKVIAYMANELFSSKAKILNMIDNGLITDEDIKSIAADLETLEDPKKKKK